MPLFISDEEFSWLSGDTAAVAVRADAYIRGVLHELDTVRAKADAADINAEQNCSLIEQRYLSLTAEFSKLESNASNLQSSLDQCLRDLSGVQAQNHQIHLQSNELKAQWEEEKSRLEKSKNDAETKYDEINEQNTILHSRLETLRIQWAEAERNVACFSPGSGGDIFGDAGLHNFINYICHLEVNEETDVPLLKLEKLLLQSQNELKAKWEEEKSRLEKSKNDAEKKYDEMKEQNKILHSRLETLRIQWAEAERNVACFSPGSGGDIFGDAGLHNFINYLCRSEEIEETEVPLLKLEKLRLQSQNELKAKWEEEKSRLEKSKNDAEKKYDEMKEQNKILHSRLETLRIQWAEAERNVACFSPGSGGNIFGDAGLHNFINYLCRSEEIEETDVPLLKLEKLRLQSQLESTIKVEESTHASLEVERAKARSFLFTEEEFKSLQLQVREMNLLRESNMQLREENKHNFEECQKMRELDQKARAETENLLREREIELESCKKEIEALKTEKYHLNHEVSGLLERSKNIGAADYDQVKKRVRGLQNELKAKWEDEKARLEKSKNDAEKKYDEISEQNKILHGRLETLRIQWAETERNAACFSPGSGGYIFGDAGLHSIFNYLCRSEEIEETGVPLLELEKLRLQLQLESAFKVAESTHASLEAEGAKARSFLFTEEEFKSLQLQVREMNLLRESNMQLREENKHNLEECQKLRELAQKARAETENLGNLLREREVKFESLKKEIELLKTKKDHLNRKLLETSKNVGAEDYDRVKKLVRGLQNKLRDRDAQIERSGRILSAKQDSISSLERDLSNCRLELKELEKRINDILHTEANLKLDVEKHRKLLAQFKKKMDVLSREKDDLGKENQQLSRQLGEIKHGKRSTSDTTGDQAMKEEKDTRMQILEKTLEKVRAELNKEKEDKCMERSRRLKTEKAIKESYNNVEQGKNQFIDDLKKHREALKRLFDEVKKLNLHEGTNVAQILSGFNVDDFSAPYISAVENFAKEAHSVFGSCGDASTITDNSATATGPLVHAQPTSIVSSAASVTSSLLPKRLALTKTSVETRKAGRRLFRSLVKLDEPQGDSESTLTSSAAESSSSKLILPVPKQGTVSVASETEEIKRASLISSMSTTINLTERARERAQLRQARVIPTTARGHGRAPCGRVVRGRGRRPTSREA